MRKSTIVSAVLCAALACVAGARAQLPNPAPTPGLGGSTGAAALQARVTALETRVTALETYVQKARSACTQFDRDLRAQAAGFRCQTKKGTFFERVSRNGFGEAWKAPDGNIWSDVIDSGYPGLSFDDAKKKCSELQARLPAPQDLQQAYTSGFLEVDPAENKNLTYWTSMTATGTAYVAGPNNRGQSVQQVGDMVWYMYSGAGYAGQWAQITPIYDDLRNRSVLANSATRCIAK